MHGDSMELTIVKKKNIELHRSRRQIQLVLNIQILHAHFRSFLAFFHLIAFQLVSSQKTFR